MDETLQLQSVQKHPRLLNLSHSYPIRTGSGIKVLQDMWLVQNTCTVRSRNWWGMKKENKRGFPVDGNQKSPRPTTWDAAKTTNLNSFSDPAFLVAMNSIPWGRELELWEAQAPEKLPSARYCQSISIQAFFVHYYCFLKRPWHHHFHVQKIQYNFASTWHSRAIVLHHCIFPLEGTNQWVTIVRYIYIQKHRNPESFILHFTSMDRYVLRFWMKTWLDDSERVILRWDDWPWNTSLLGRCWERFLCLAEQVGN